MVQILPESQSFASQLGAALGGGLSQGMSKAADFALELQMEKAKRGLLAQQSLQTIPGKLQGSGLGSTVTGVNVGQQLQGQRQAQQQIGEQPISDTKFRRSILTPDQIESEAAQAVQRKASAGIPTTFENEMALLNQRNAQVAQFQQVQEAYGQKSVEALEKVMKGSTDEQQAVIKQKAENYAQMGLTPAEVDKKLALDAKQFANELARVRNSLPPKRLMTRLKQGLLGTGREAEKERVSIQNKLRPLKEQGLYDTARSMLEQQGYGPEERESLLTSLSDTAEKQISQLPKVKHFFAESIVTPNFMTQANEEEKLAFENNLESVLQKDPAANLILLRKKYEDKGYDWRSVKDKIDSLISEDKFTPNEDQWKTLDYLDEPPLNRLDKLLYNLKLVGR
jgi:hypothetical protein